MRLKKSQKLMKMTEEPEEAVKLTNQSESRSLIWVMDAGPSITSQPKSKPDSTDRQKSSSEHTTIPLLIFGPWHAWCLSSSQVTSYLSRVKVSAMTRTMTILPK